MSDRKRTFEGNDSNSPSKKPRTGDGAPSNSTPASVAAQLAAARAQIQAKMAKMVPPKPSSGPANIPAANNTSEMTKRVMEARKKLEEAVKNRNPQAQRDFAPPSASRPSLLDSNSSDPKSRTSGPAIHPLLLETPTIAQPLSKKDRYKPMLPKFATTKANARIVQNTPIVQPKKLALETAIAPTLEEARKDPHFDRRLGVETLLPKSVRAGRSLRFNQKGKFVQMADAMRQEAKMEALKQRILEAARKAGLEDEMEADGGLGKKLKKPEPPAVEWWDSAFVQSENYDDLDRPDAQIIWEASCSDLVQHPIPIPAPGDKNETQLKALMLTKKERKKMRRIRRAAALKDHQDRVKMGLLPPDPPKVKLSNMMRVLTQDAVADPTKVEAKVRREMMARRDQHEKANTERKLTTEQRHEKIEAKAREEEKKGIYAAAFKIKHLSNPSHKFKVRKNAEQLFLTGVCLYTPKFALVVVEGSAHSIKKYKRLMLERIDWTEEITATVDNPPEGGPDDAPVEKIDFSKNSCLLVWEGEHRERVFKSGFRPKSCPTDQMARDFLGKAEGVFDVARKFEQAQGDL